MKKSIFQFKQFSIIQEKSAQKVGTDGVLLGALAKGEQATSILDVGTGTGLIAIMLAQRFTATIEAVEIDLEAASEAAENAKNCPWNNRIRIIHSSFQEFANNCGITYQLIVSNPPYFQNSLKSENSIKNLARHNDSLTTTELLEGIKKLLSHDGIFQIIVPSENYTAVLAEALSVGLFCNERVWIKPTPEKNPKRVVLAFSWVQNEVNEYSLVIEQGGRHQYSEEYKRLTNGFYLAF
jgi:tRNA1Val (adenine37-N6)-methyltransferase